MSQTTSQIPQDNSVFAATDVTTNQPVFFTIAELRQAMSPIGYMTPADQLNAAAAAAAQATANAAIPIAQLGQPLGPVQSDASNKVPVSNLPSAVLGSSHYLGTWNASTNSPALVSGTAPAISNPTGGYYIVSVAGTRTIDGTASWNVGDWIIWNGTSWDHLSGQANPVSSVAGLQGAVTTGQLATALAGNVALSSSGGSLNVVLGTGANTAAAGNDSRIVNAMQAANVTTHLANVAAIAGYTGGSPSLRTAGYYTVGDGGGAFYTQTNTGAPAITDGAGRNWYLQDLDGQEVNILQFGAKPDYYTDMQPAWAAADAYATANHKGVFIPSAQAGGGWRLVTPMVINASSTRCEAPGQYGQGGTSIQFSPSTITDKLAAVTVNGNGTLVANLTISGPQNIPSLSTLMTSGWVISSSSFQGTISGTGTTMNIVSGQTGTPNVGDQVSGVGMTNGPSTITAISGSTLTISPAQPLISTAQTFTTCALPNYSAIAAGVVGIAVNGQAVLRNCSTQRCKIGILINTMQGHAEFHSCTPGGFIGAYVLDNSYDFSWYGGAFGGVWAGLAFGTTNFIGGNGGVQGTWFRVQFPLQAAHHIYQFKDGNYSGSSLGINGSFYGCSFESCNEAAIQTLPDAISFIRLFACTQQWGGTALPSTITPTPQRSLFRLGDVRGFEADPNPSNLGTGAWAASALGAGAYPQYSLTAYLNPSPNNKVDIRHLDGNLNILQAMGRWVGNYRSIENAQKGDLAVRQDMLPCGNLLKNPEQNTAGNGLSGGGGNWTAANSTVTIQSFSSFPELAGVALPQSVQEVLGTNPMVVKIVQNIIGGTQSTNNNAYLAPVSSPYHLGVSIPVWLRFWQLQLGSPQQIGWRLTTPSSFLYNYTQTPQAGVLTEILGVNQTLGSAGDTTGNITGLTIFLNKATTIYLFGVMAGAGEIAPYNPLPVPYAAKGLALGDNSVTDAQTAVNIITGTGAPSSTTQPPGTLYLRKDGTTTGLYQYVNGGWISY